MVTLTDGGKAKLDALLAEQVVHAGLPALFYGLTSADGELYYNCAGKKNEGDASEGEVNDQTTLQLFSQTKLITSIACLQLVEKGVLAVDDPALIEKHLPELWAQPILTGLSDDGKPITTPRTKPITLRHLLTHTAGLAYTFSSPLIAKWEAATGAPSWIANNAEPSALAQPTLFEPGSKFCYGINIDWAGVLVMRVTGQTLEEYFHEHIFGPIGLTKEDISFYPSDSIKERLMQSCALLPDGKLIPSPGLRDVKNMRPEDVGVHLGGAGLLGTLKAYMAVLREILLAKDGKSKVISPAVYAALFQPALPARDGTNTTHADLGAMVAFEGLDETQFISGDHINHSLGMALFETDSAMGPKAGSAWWGGAARTRFWVDPATGVAGVYGTQMFDGGQVATFAKAYKAYQRELYDALAV